MKDLEKHLKDRLKKAKRIAILGIGSDLRGDDAAGVLAASAVKDYCASGGNRKKYVRVFIGDTAPENLTGEIRGYKPTHLVIIDTIEINQKPGTVLVLEPSDIGGGVSFSTHKMPSRVLIEYFRNSFKCDVILIGIQPKSIDFGKSVSADVKGSSKEVASAICRAIHA